MSVLRSHNNKTRGGLGRVCATGMYRSIEHVKFPKFQTGIFVEWKAPLKSFCGGKLTLAQSVERLTAEREVVGSIPGIGPILRVLK